jgi:hypothetical protein
VEFLDQVVVSRARGRKLGWSFLKDWACENWGKSLSYEPKIRSLAKGWFAYILNSKEGAD